MAELGTELEAAIRKRLKDRVELTALLGEGATIDWDVRPSAAAYSIVLGRIAGPIAVHFKGNQGLQETRVQVDVWGKDGTKVKKIAHLARTTLEPPAIVAATGPNMGAGVRFERGFADQPDPATEETPTGLVHRSRFDIMIWWALIE